MTLAILERHPVPPMLGAQFGSYGQMVLEMPGSDLAARAFELHDGDYPARMSDVDALALTGLPIESRETDASDVEALLLDALGKVRVIALGEFHSTLAALLGGAVGAHPAPNGLSLEIFDVRQTADWMEPCTSTAAFAPRQTRVSRPPADAVVLAGSSIDPNAILCYPALRAISLNSHPEWSGAFVRAFLEGQAAATAGTEPPSPHRLNTTTLPHDGRRIGTWIRRFIAESSGDRPDRGRLGCRGLQ